MTALPAEPGGIPGAFAAAWMARDATALAALFAEKAEFVNVVGLWWHDRAAIEKAHDYALQSFFAETRLTPGTIRVKHLGDDVAIVQCRFTLTGQRLPDGGAAGPRRTILTFVAQRTTEGWITQAAQNTDIVDGAETMAHAGTLRAADYRG